MSENESTSISVSRDVRDRLYTLKRPADSWDDTLTRLLSRSEVDTTPHPAWASESSNP